MVAVLREKQKRMDVTTKARPGYGPMDDDQDNPIKDRMPNRARSEPKLAIAGWEILTWRSQNQSAGQRFNGQPHVENPGIQAKRQFSSVYSVYSVVSQLGPWRMWRGSRAPCVGSESGSEAPSRIGGPKTASIRARLAID
jgi:hypothetical protein